MPRIGKDTLSTSTYPSIVNRLWSFGLWQSCLPQGAPPKGAVTADQRAQKAPQEGRTARSRSSSGRPPRWASLS
jgi:hypothetical protein